MAQQMEAVRGGRRIRPGYLPAITAEAKQLPALYRMRDLKKYRADLAAQREKELALAKKSVKLQEKQAKIGTGISAVQVGATGYMARKMAVGKTATTTAAPATATGTEAGTAPLAAGGKTTTAQYAGAGVGGYVAGRYLGKPVGEEAIPSSIVKGKRSRGRWGGMMAGAATGTVIAGPGWGTAIGAVAGLIGAW